MWLVNWYVTDKISMLNLGKRNISLALENPSLPLGHSIRGTSFGCYKLGRNQSLFSNMNAAFYETGWYSERLMFWFTSTGRESIVKVILFKPTQEADVYEIALGDLNSDGSIDLDARSDNGDTEEVLSTVAKALLFFLSDHAEAQVVVEASSDSRARLYQIAIKRELGDLGDYLVAYGFDNENPEVLQNGKNYKKFVISLREDGLEF